jgi:6-phosphofructokinase 1
MVMNMAQLSKIAVLTSGGDAPGMNAAIRAIVIAATHYQIEVIGFLHGYNGLIENESVRLSLKDVNNIIHKGGTILKSARCPSMLSEKGLKQAANTLLKEQVDAFIVIGGDGSFLGLISLQQYYSGLVIGIPGTIDNDLDGTDFTIGFSTAVNTAIEAVDKIRDTANAFERVFVIELMGRQSGHISFNVGVACGAEQVISFENFNPKDQAIKLEILAQEIKIAQRDKYQSYLIVIAENLWPGGAIKLVEQLKEYQSIDATACILGHIQRGGSPVAKDRILATKMGVSAVQKIIDGKSNLMIGEKDNTICEVLLINAVKHQKKVNSTLIKAQESILAFTAQHLK